MSAEAHNQSARKHLRAVGRWYAAAKLQINMIGQGPSAVHSLRMVERKAKLAADALEQEKKVVSRIRLKLKRQAIRSSTRCK